MMKQALLLLLATTAELAAAKRVPTHMRSQDAGDPRATEQPLLPSPSAGSNQVLRRAFADFTATFNKSYATTEEFEERLALWIEADQYIQNYDLRNTTVRLRHNRFSDMSRAEKQRALGRGHPESNEYARARETNFSDLRGVTICNPRYEECTCPGGYFLKRGVCTACPKGCTECTSGNICRSCWTDDFQMDDNTCKCTEGPVSRDKQSCTAGCPAGTLFSYEH